MWMWVAHAAGSGFPLSATSRHKLCHSFITSVHASRNHVCLSFTIVHTLAPGLSPPERNHTHPIGRTHTKHNLNVRRAAQRTHHPHTPLQSPVSQHSRRSLAAVSALAKERRACGEPRAAHATRSPRATPPTRRTSFQRLPAFPSQVPPAASPLATCPLCRVVARRATAHTRTHAQHRHIHRLPPKPPVRRRSPEADTRPHTAGTPPRRHTTASLSNVSTNAALSPRASRTESARCYVHAHPTSRVVVTRGHRLPEPPPHIAATRTRRRGTAAGAPRLSRSPRIDRPNGAAPCLIGRAAQPQ